MWLFGMGAFLKEPDINYITSVNLRRWICSLGTMEPTGNRKALYDSDSLTALDVLDVPKLLRIQSVGMGHLPGQDAKFGYWHCCHGPCAGDCDVPQRTAT